MLNFRIAPKSAPFQAFPLCLGSRNAVLAAAVLGTDPGPAQLLPIRL
jgi:hypothetical protein